MKPVLILADEPTGNLDTKSADVPIEMMRTINRENCTIFLIVTHSMDIVHRCDRIIDVVDGQIV